MAQVQNFDHGGDVKWSQCMSKKPGTPNGSSAKLRSRWRCQMVSMHVQETRDSQWLKCKTSITVEMSNGLNACPRNPGLPMAQVQNFDHGGDVKWSQCMSEKPGTPNGSSAKLRSRWRCQMVSMHVRETWDS